MNKKLAVKLIATVMAMTMVVGMGMSVLAAEPGPSSCNEAGTYANANYAIPSSFSGVPASVSDINALPAGEYYTIEATEALVAAWNEFNSAISDPSTHEHTGGKNCSDEYSSVISGKFDALKAAYVAFVASKMTSDGSNYHPGSCGSVSSTPETPKSDPVEEALKALEATIQTEEALPVTSFASAAAVAAIPAEAKAAGTTATMNISNVTTSQGFVAAVKKIATASAAAPSVSVYSSKPIALNAASVNAISNTNKPFIYTFSYKGRLYRITIPAGAKVNLGKTGFAGPLGIGAQFGTTEVLK